MDSCSNGPLQDVLHDALSQLSQGHQHSFIGREYLKTNLHPSRSRTCASDTHPLSQS